jgi:hypothetical protein
MYKLSRNLIGDRRVYVHRSFSKDESSKLHEDPKEKRSALASVLAIAVLSVGFALPGTVKADNLPVVNLQPGTLTEDLTLTTGNVYVINGDVTIPDGITVTVDPGAIIKNSAWYSQGFQVQSGGILDVNGTSTQPVIFTSYKDDTAGGDTNNNGPSTGIEGDYNGSINANGNATVDIDYGVFRFGYSSVVASCSSDTLLSLEDSLLKGSVWIYGCDAENYSLKRNQIDARSGYGIGLSDSDPRSIILDGVDKNTALGDGQGAAIYLQGNPTIPAGQTWDISGTSGIVLAVKQLVVDGTLNLKDGAIVKYDQSYQWLKVEDGGVLNIAGTLSNKVVMTSLKDDSVGGDTNGNGASSGSYGDFNAVVEMSPGAVVNANYVVTKYGYNSFAANCDNAHQTSLVVDDSVLEGTVNMFGCKAGEVNLKRNQFASQLGYAVRSYTSDISGIILAGVNQNTGSGTGQGIAISVESSSKVSANTEWNVSGASGVVLSIADLDLQGKMTVQDGAILKMQYSFSNAIDVQDGGELAVTGTSSAPIVFTSSKDDAVGGDTNGDGPSTRGVADYYGAVGFGNSSKVNLTYTVMRGGGFSVSGGCDENTDVIVQDSEILSEVYITYCTEGELSFMRNKFAPEGGYAAQVSFVDMSGFIMDGDNKNYTTGSGKSATIYARYSTVPSGQAWTLSGSTGITLLLESLYVDGSLALEDGQIVKGRAIYYPTIEVRDGGNMTAIGDPTNPIIFTSHKDDSYAGDSDGYGTSTGTVGDYNTAFLASAGGEVLASHIKIKYASGGISAGQEAAIEVSNADISNVGEGVWMNGGNVKLASSNISNATTGLKLYGGQATFRGSFASISGKAVESCNWGYSTPCSVDAAYTDWNSSTGPFASSSANNMICGAVYISPWIYNSVEHETNDVYIAKNCDNSPTPADTVDSGLTHFSQRVSLRQIDCSNGFQDACDAITTAYACLNGAFDVAQTQTPWPLPPSDTASQIDALGSLARESAAEYMSTQASPSPAGFNLSLFNSLISVTSTMLTIGGAYSACAP